MAMEGQIWGAYSYGTAINQLEHLVVDGVWSDGELPCQQARPGQGDAVGVAHGRCATGPAGPSYRWETATVEAKTLDRLTQKT